MFTFKKKKVIYQNAFTTLPYQFRCPPVLQWWHNLPTIHSTNIKSLQNQFWTRQGHRLSRKWSKKKNKTYADTYSHTFMKSPVSYLMILMPICWLRHTKKKPVLNFNQQTNEVLCKPSICHVVYRLHSHNDSQKLLAAGCLCHPSDSSWRSTCYRDVVIPEDIYWLLLHC